jgi:hypothetical protein
MTRQCLGRERIPTIEKLNSEVGAWADNVNGKQKGLHWPMTIDHARVKLTSHFTWRYCFDEALVKPD